MIFYRKDLEEQINQSVFPGLQGGPHNHTISGIAVALKMAAGTEFKAYQQQIVANCRAMGDRCAADSGHRHRITVPFTTTASSVQVHQGTNPEALQHSHDSLSAAYISN